MKSRDKKIFSGATFLAWLLQFTVFMIFVENCAGHQDSFCVGKTMFGAVLMFAVTAAEAIVALHIIPAWWKWMKEDD